MGLGQFLDETWLDLIRAHRPDLARGRSKEEILELRRDAKLAREITKRFTEQNAEMLRKRGFPVTPGRSIWRTFPVARELWRFCQHWMMPTPPRLWLAPMQRVVPSERRSSRPTHSSNALRSSILEVGPIARCAFRVHSRRAAPTPMRTDKTHQRPPLSLNLARRKLLAALGGAVVARPLAARAQQRDRARQRPEPHGKSCWRECRSRRSCGALWRDITNTA